MKIIFLITLTSLAISTTGTSAYSRAIKPEFVDLLLAPYFSIQEALSSDDLAEAKASAGSLQIMLGHGPLFANAPSLLDMQVQAKAIAAASDIKAARKSFLNLSEGLTEMVELIGTTGAQDVFKMICHMALEGKGGTWMQTSENPANPYMGSLMYRCGSVQAKLTGSMSPERPGHSSQCNHAQNQGNACCNPQ